MPCTCRPACACLRIASQDALALMHTVWHLPSIRLALVLEGATKLDESWLCKTQGASPNLDPALDSYCFCPSPFCVDLRLAWEYRSLCPVTLSSHLMRGAQHWQPSCVALVSSNGMEAVFIHSLRQGLAVISSTVCALLGDATLLAHKVTAPGRAAELVQGSLTLMTLHAHLCKKKIHGRRCVCCHGAA